MPRLALCSATAGALAMALTASAAGAQAPTKSKATTQAAAAQATGKPTTDGPSTTLIQGTAKAVQEGAPAAAATTALSAGATTPKVAPHGDLVETARASGQFTVFLKAADATNLTSLLKNNQGLTVFAPTDAAFAALPPGELDRLMADKPALQKLLTHHIINARVDSSKIRGAKGPVPSVAGDPIELDGSGEVLKADNADIVQPDVMATNGILQVVDRVLTPGAPAASASGAAASATAPASTTNTPAAPAKPKGT